MRRECHPSRLHPPPVIIPINGDHLQASDVSTAMKASVIDTGDPVTLQVPPIVNLAPLMQSLNNVKPSGKIHIDKPMLRTTSQSIPSSLCIEVCSPIEHKYPPSVFNNFVVQFVRSLPLSNCSVSPNIPFNLSASQLNSDGVGVRMSNSGDHLEFDGFRFRCIRLHGLYLIDLLKPLHGYAKMLL